MSRSLRSSNALYLGNRLALKIGEGFWVLHCLHVELIDGETWLSGLEVVLKRAGVCKERKAGKHIMYSTDDCDSIIDVSDLLQEQEQGLYKLLSMSAIQGRCGGAKWCKAHMWKTLTLHTPQSQTTALQLDEYNDEKKALVNSQIYELAKQLVAFRCTSDASVTALILDAAAHRTTTSLRAAGLLDSDICIANSDPHTSSLLKRALPQVDVRACTVNTVIANINHKLDIIYLDYCCTWQGNSMCSPLKDFELLFDRRLVADGAVFAYTLSRRNKQIEQYSYAHDAVRKQFQHLALSRAFIALEMRSVSYGQMYSSVYKMQKR